MLCVFVILHIVLLLGMSADESRVPPAMVELTEANIPCVIGIWKVQAANTMVTRNDGVLKVQCFNPSLSLSLIARKVVYKYTLVLRLSISSNNTDVSIVHTR